MTEVNVEVGFSGALTGRDRAISIGKFSATPSIRALYFNVNNSPFFLYLNIKIFIVFLIEVQDFIVKLFKKSGCSLFTNRVGVIVKWAVKEFAIYFCFFLIFGEILFFRRNE